MSRAHFSFACEGARLVATLDRAESETALLIVSGGNETRAGAWNGQALLAATIAAAGHPVLRFDRRGVGDSEGENGTFRGSAADIAAAVATLRSEAPQVTRVVGLGNCDAASALMLAGGAGCDALILSNPWTIEDEAEEVPAEVVRDHYRRRLADPAAIRRLLTGKVSIPQLARSLASALRPAPSGAGDTDDSLASQMARGIADFAGPVRFLVAERDRTGQAFLAKWKKGDPRILKCADATHSFVEPHARDWYAQRVLEVLRGA